MIGEVCQTTVRIGTKLQRGVWCFGNCSKVVIFLGSRIWAQCKKMLEIATHECLLVIKSTVNSQFSQIWAQLGLCLKAQSLARSQKFRAPSSLTIFFSYRWFRSKSTAPWKSASKTRTIGDPPTNASTSWIKVLVEEDTGWFFVTTWGAQR